MTSTDVFLQLVRAGTPPDRAGLAVGWSKTRTRAMIAKHQQTINDIQDAMTDAVILSFMRG